MQDNTFLQATEDMLMCNKTTSKNKETHKNTSKASYLKKVYLLFFQAMQVILSIW